MKKLIKFAIPLFFVIVISSCKAEEVLSTCTTCTEYRTSFSTDFCGTSAEVNLFISELKKQGSAAGQSWTCVKK